MSLKSRTIFVCACAALMAATALAATTPVTVFPNPVQFATVPLNSTSSLFVNVGNPSASPVTISAMTISGSSSASFAFAGLPCTGTISAGQFCQMNITFTPGAMGNITATLVITETGVKNPINVPLDGAGGNPIPTITSLSPPTLYLNSPSTTITINGSGFLSSTLAYLQSSNTPLPTTFVSATQIKTKIPDTALASTGDVFVFVTNPSPGGGSTTADLPVVAQDPSINSVTPVSIVAGTAPEPVIVDGQNFMAGAKVEWNGVGIPTSYLSSSQLQIQPTRAELATPGLVQLSVSNPPPGTISPPITFNVTYPNKVTVLDLPANDLVWDPFAQRLYASLPSSFGPNGNSIAVINPTTGAVTGYFFAGSEPNKLALDSTSTYLYVGLDGSGSIERLKVSGFTPDIQISLGNGSNGGPNLAGAIAVSPANPRTIAVGLPAGGCCFSSGQLEFFTNSTQLANSVTSEPISQLAFASGTTLYGYDPGGTLSQIAVDPTGGTLGQVWTNLVTGNTFQYAGGLIFGSNGEEFNPATGLLSGTFDVNGNTCCSGVELLPNSAIKRALALGVTPFFNSFGITSYNLTQFTPLAVASLEELGSTFNSPTALKFLQTGPSGLAFIVTSSCCGTTTSQVVLVQSPTLLLAKTTTPSPVPVVQSASPSAVTHGRQNFLMTVRGSGFVPGSAVEWNGKPQPASYVSASQMTVYVSRAEVAAAGTAVIAITNPAPGGGTSNSLTFNIN